MVEGLKDALAVGGRDARAIVGHAKGEHVAAHIERNQHTSALLRKLDGVGNEVAHHLLRIVGHKVALGLLLLGRIHQLYAVAVGQVEVALHHRRHEEHEVAVAPVGLANGRLHLLDVEQLIDERQQARALARHHVADVHHLLGRQLALLHHVRIAEDNGERGAKLVGDIGEEREAHLVHLLLRQLLALTRAEGVDQETHDHGGEHEDQHGGGDAHHLQGALGAILLVDGVDLGLALLMLVANAHVLHVDEVLLARHAVAKLVVGLVAGERTAAVALLAVNVIVEPRHLRLVLERVERVGRLVGNGEVVLGLGVVAQPYIHLRQGEAGLHGVPPVVGGRHDVVGLAVFGNGLGRLALLLIEPAEMGVAKRYAEV